MRTWVSVFSIKFVNSNISRSPFTKSHKDNQTHGMDWWYHKEKALRSKVIGCILMIHEGCSFRSLSDVDLK